MADINIPISVRRGDTSGLDAIQRQIFGIQNQVKQARTDLTNLSQQATGGGIRVPFLDDPVVRRRPQTYPPLPQAAMVSPPRPGSREWYEAKGLRFVPPGTPPGQGPPPGTPPPATSRLRPFPANIPPSPFGAAGGGPPGTPQAVPPRVGSPAWLAEHGYVFVPPGTPPGQMPGQAPATPPPPPGAAGWSPGARYAASAGLGLVGQMGTVGHIAQSAIAGGLIGGPIGALAGGGAALIGAGLAKAGEAMDAWKQRARGVLQVGQLLDQNFGAITRSVIGLNKGLDESDKGLDILSQQTLETIEAMSRATGRMPSYATLRQTAGFGVAYGMAPAQAGALAGTFSMLGVGANPLARVAAGARNAFGTGGLPMRMDVLQEEAARIAGIGGTTAVPMDQEYYGRVAGMIGGMGTRYQLPGAAAGFAERFAQGAANAPDDMTFMLRHRALDQLMRERQRRGLGTTLQIGQGANAETVDLTSWQGRRIAMELAAQSPEILEAYRRTGQLEAGGNPELGGIMFETMVGGGRLGPTEARRLQRRVTEGGGFQRILTGPGRATAETEQAEIDAREARRRGAPEALPQRAEAATQAMMERLGGDFAPKFLEAQLKLLEVEGKVEQTVREQFNKLSETISNQFPHLGEQLGKAVEALTTLSAKMDQASSQAAREGGLWGQMAPVASLIPLWGAVQEGWSSTQRPAPVGPNTGAELGWPLVQPHRARGH